MLTEALPTLTSHATQLLRWDARTMQVARFHRDYGPLADSIARLDLPPANRQRLAETISEALRSCEDFLPEAFQLRAAA